jgi:hypothetical protein
MSGDQTEWNSSTDTLTLLEHGSIVAMLNITQPNLTAADFGVGEDANGDAEIVVLQPPPTDFSGAGMSDALWRSSSGTLALWLMNGAAITGSQSPTYQGTTPTPDSSWSVAGIGDFNGNLEVDIIWRQSTTGLLLDWDMSGSTILSSTTITYQGSAPTPDSTWSVAGIGDFNGDGNDDILWRQSTTGSLVDWTMNGAQISSTTAVTDQGSAVTPDSTWSVAGIGDFNTDGQSEILWRQSSTDALSLWTMNGSTITSSQTITYQGSAVTPDSSWSVVGIGDFNGDGHADILWRQAGTNTLAEWQMNGATVESSAPITYQGGAVTPDSTGTSFRSATSTAMAKRTSCGSIAPRARYPNG